MSRPPIDDLLEKLDKVQDHFKVQNRRKFPQLTSVEAEIDCDTDKLYHHDLGVAIQYLVEIKTQYPNASLDEKWTGYEDMYMRFVYDRPETDDEYYDRLQSELFRLTRERTAHDERVRKKAIQDQIDKLKAQL